MTATIIRSEKPIAFAGVPAVLVETVFVAATVLMPIAAHTLGWPVFVVLPMFWGVMLSGVVFGWKTGLVVGALSPVLNFVLTGMPIAPLVPIMTVELAVYGALPALLAQKAFRGNLYIGMAISMVVGRLVVLAGFLMFLGGPEGLPGWLSMQFLPGLPMQAAQIALVPILGGMIIRALRRDEGENAA